MIRAALLAIGLLGSAISHAPVDKVNATNYRPTPCDIRAARIYDPGADWQQILSDVHHNRLTPRMCAEYVGAHGWDTTHDEL